MEFLINKRSLLIIAMALMATACSEDRNLLLQANQLTCDSMNQWNGT